MTDPFDLWLQTPESDTRTFDEFVADMDRAAQQPIVTGDVLEWINRRVGAPILFEPGFASVFYDVHVESR